MEWKTGCRANSYLPNEPVEVEPQSVPVWKQELESKLEQQRVAFDWCAAAAVSTGRQNEQEVRTTIGIFMHLYVWGVVC